MIALLVPVARAAGLEPVSALIQEAGQAVEEGDIEAFHAAHEEVTAAISEHAEVLAPGLAARHLMNLAVVAHYENRGSWELPLAAALRADPTVPRPDSRVSPISAWRLPEQDNREALRVPEGYVVYLDGRQTLWLSRQAETHFIQVEHGDALTSAFVEARAPAAWLETRYLSAPEPLLLPPPAEPRDPVLIAGCGAAGAGIAMVVGTLVAHSSHRGEPYPAQGAIRAGNLTGWGLTVVGGGLVGSALWR